MNVFSSIVCSAHETEVDPVAGFNLSFQKVYQDLSNKYFKIMNIIYLLSEKYHNTIEEVEQMYH